MYLSVHSYYYTIYLSSISFVSYYIYIKSEFTQKYIYFFIRFYKYILYKTVLNCTFIFITFSLFNICKLIYHFHCYYDYDYYYDWQIDLIFTYFLEWWIEIVKRKNIDLQDFIQEFCRFLPNKFVANELVSFNLF